MMTASLPLQGNPYDLNDDQAYRIWRDDKMEQCPSRAEDLIVEIKDPYNLSKAEFNALKTRCQSSNMAIYVSNSGSNPDKSIPSTLAREFGLTELDNNMGADNDGITSLKVAYDPWHKRYIPYTNRPIHWHTDGYYNPVEKQINALMLHCVSPAAMGGENALLDHELAYIHLRDLNPDYIEALMSPQAMSIPANIKNNEVIRPVRNGPVFSVRTDGKLHMRYTARKRNVDWNKDATTREAVNALNNFLASDSPHIFRLTLQPGQGLICNNVLHDRSGFNNDEKYTRLLYRLRFYQRIAGS